MNIPTYWARAQGQVEQGPLTGAPLSAWGWSDTSKGDAWRHAEERLAKALERMAQSGDLPRGYGYGDRPFREERLEALEHGGEEIGVLTRNALGCLVLNTQTALFLDIDFPKTSGGFLSLFRKPKKTPEEQAREDIEQALAAHPGSYRLYRTAAGLRVMATAEPIPPDSTKAKALLGLPGVDPYYRRLCATQESFRARLSPKHWRCGIAKPPSRFPFQESGEREAFDSWLQHYDRATGDYATCAFLEALGGDTVDERIAPLVELHDEKTRAHSDLPLA